MKSRIDKTKFDRIIKSNLTKYTDLVEELGYKDMGNTEKVFPLYYSNEVFANFLEEMKNMYPDIYNAYAQGKGSEILGNPPKMASVASSSRFCYLSLRNASLKDFGFGYDSKFEFEKDLLVSDIVGPDPQMDAYSIVNNTSHFFEFKCHEIFDSHEQELSSQYDKYFKKWRVIRSNKMIPFDEFSPSKIVYFDVKQFITHLTGIVNDPSPNKVFSYVYFKPYGVPSEIYDELELEVYDVFNSELVTRICLENNIELRLYYYENDIMDGFEKKIKPRLIQTNRDALKNYKK